MNTKLKYTLAFAAVLLIGFVVGFLVGGTKPMCNRKR